MNEGEALLLFIYTLYRHPRDFPDDYVTRRFRILKGRVVREKIVSREYTLEQLRATLPSDATPLGRQERDEPQIIESWLSFTELPDLSGDWNIAPPPEVAL